MNKANQDQVKAFVAEAKESGKSDVQIYDALKRNPALKQNFASAKQKGFDDVKIARGLGLYIGGGQASKPQSTPSTNNQAGASGGQKVQYDKPTFREDMGRRASGFLGGIKQGGLYVADGLAGLSNKALGTNFETDDYERYTKAKAEEHAIFDNARKESGKGFDWGGLVFDAVGFGKFGKAYNGAKLLTTQGAKITAQNAGLGAMVGAMDFAKDGDERLSKTAMGAITAPVGGVVAEKLVGKPLAKAMTRHSVTDDVAKTAVNKGLAKEGLKLDDLPTNVADDLVKQAKKALKAGKTLDDDVVGRTGLIKKYGINPTKAQANRNATDWTKERELAKLDSTEGILTNKYVNDDDQLRQMLDDEIMATGGKKTDDYAFNQELLKTAQDKIAQNKAKASEAYRLAQQSTNNNIDVDAVGFVDDVYGQFGKFASHQMPTEIKGLLQQIKDEGMTMGESEDLVKFINNAYQGTINNGQPTMYTHALKQIRETLEKWQQKALDNASSASDGLWGNARSIHKQNRALIESMPLLKDAEKGVEPDKMFSKHIIGGNIGQLRTTMDFLKAENPQLVADIKQSVLEYIAKNAINDTKGFSPAGMKKALDRLGEPRLKSIFNDDELKRLTDLRLVGELLKQAPIENSVNHSHTASTLANMFGTLIGNTPVLKVLKIMREKRMAGKILNGASLVDDTVPINYSPSGQKASNTIAKLGVITGINADE